MSTNLRQQQILELLEENGAVSVKDLTRRLFVSEATVRRDLCELEKQGALQRNYGGATSVLAINEQVPLFIREGLDGKAKNEICRRAAAIVKNGDTVFLDGSSTVQYLVTHLAHLENVTVVTYSIKTAELACQNHIKTYCVGGLLMENSLVCTGAMAIAFAEQFNVDVAFLSCKGVSEDGRFTDTSEEETAIRRAFLQNARTSALLMTQNKFGNTYLHTLCHARDVDYLFSDGEIPSSIQTRQ